MKYFLPFCLQSVFELNILLTYEYMYSLHISVKTMTEVRIPDDGGNTIRMADVGGFITPIFFRSAPEIKDIYDKLPEYKFRNDDLMLCTFAKTGKWYML